MQVQKARRDLQEAKETKRKATETLQEATKNEEEKKKIFDKSDAEKRNAELANLRVAEEVMEHEKRRRMDPENSEAGHPGYAASELARCLFVISLADLHEHDMYVQVVKGHREGCEERKIENRQANS